MGREKREDGEGEKGGREEARKGDGVTAKA